MSDQATHSEQSATPAPSASAGAPSPAGTDVLKIIADVEGQLSRLRGAQRQQDDAVAMLTARSKALRAAEEDLDHQRVTLKQQSILVERERGQLQQDRDQFTEQCKRMDDDLRRRSAEIEQAQQKLERERSEASAQLEQAKRGAAEIEQAKTVWQQHRQQVEEQLQRSQGEIDQRLADCVKARDEVASARSQWEKQRQDAQAKLDARALELDQQAAAHSQRENALQQAREQLAAAEQQSQRQREELQNRAAALEFERGDLIGRVDQAERNVGELIAQVERTQEELVEQTRHVKKAMETVALLQQREKQLEKAVEAAAEHARKTERESQDLLKLADGEHAELRTRLEAAGKELKGVCESRDAAMAELESARKKIASMQMDLRTREETIAARDAQLIEMQRKLEMAGGKLSEFAEVLSEQTPQLERGAAALAMVSEQAEQIDRLTKQLAELQLASDPAELQHRDQRINELTEALRQSRGQNAGEQGVAEVEQRNAMLEQALQESRLELQNAQIAAEEARKQLQAYVESGAEAQVKDVALAEHAAKVAALTAEIERLHSAAALELEQKLSAQSKRHQQELSGVRQTEQSVSTLRQRVADLEAQVAQAKAETANAAAAGDNESAEYATRLRAKAEQITSVAEHLRRRRDRLMRMRQLLQKRQKSAPAAATSPAGAAAQQIRSEQLSQIERERQHLMEVRKMLADSEYQMIRRWARPRAVMTATCLAVVVAVATGATWLAVNFFFPATVSASVVLEARSRTGSETLSAQQQQEWNDWHAGAVRDAGFQQTLAKRMSDRRLEDWSRPESVAARLGQDVSVDATHPGMVIYTMSGTDADQITTFLDVFTNTLLSESTRESGRRSDGAVAIASGERKEEGMVKYARLNAAPVHDERMQHALPIFGGALGGLLLLTIVSYLKLARSKRVFEDEHDEVVDEPQPAAA